MPQNRFSLQQLQVSIAWVSAGFACFVFSGRRWDFPMHPHYDFWATAVPVAQVVAFLCGPVLITFGVIYVLFARRRLTVLMHVLCGGLMGLFVGAIIESPLTVRATETGIPTALGGMIAGMMTMLFASWIIATREDRASAREPEASLRSRTRDRHGATDH